MNADGGEWVWLDRFVNGASPDFAERMKADWNTEKIPDVATLEERWEGLDRDLREFLRTLQDDRLQLRF